MDNFSYHPDYTSVQSSQPDLASSSGTTLLVLPVSKGHLRWFYLPHINEEVECSVHRWKTVIDGGPF